MRFSVWSQIWSINWKWCNLAERMPGFRLSWGEWEFTVVRKRVVALIYMGVLFFRITEILGKRVCSGAVFSLRDGGNVSSLSQGNPFIDLIRWSTNRCIRYGIVFCLKIKYQIFLRLNWSGASFFRLRDGGNLLPYQSATTKIPKVKRKLSGIHFPRPSSLQFWS